MAQKYEGGVRYYTSAKVTIKFPESDINCRSCPLLGVEYGLKREYCKRTGEYIPDPDYMIGGDCPLEFGKEE